MMCKWISNGWGCDLNAHTPVTVHESIHNQIHRYVHGNRGHFELNPLSSNCNTFKMHWNDVAIDWHGSGLSESPLFKLIGMPLIPKEMKTHIGSCGQGHIRWKMKKPRYFVNVSENPPLSMVGTKSHTKWNYLEKWQRILWKFIFEIYFKIPFFEFVYPFMAWQFKWIWIQWPPAF